MFVNSNFSMEDNNKQSHCQICVVTVENFPSRVELFKLIDSFLREEGLPLSYKVFNKDNALKFYFPSPETALETVKRLSIEKVSNEYYSGMLVYLSFENKADSSKDQIIRTNFGHRKVGRHLSSGNGQSKMKLSGKDLTNPPNPEEMSFIHRKMLDLSSRAGIINNDSPYIEEDRAFRLREKDNEKKNISKQRFNSCFGKATVSKSTNNYISNYVNVTPSVPVNQFKFRPDEKSKWINKKGFKLY